ncbi:MAG TPA: insulinase family protein, partial [Steroidobacteraceae bacterium]|nr:insulinase family protein [Steroidobacteraceae bacterium]
MLLIGAAGAQPATTAAIAPAATAATTPAPAVVAGVEFVKSFAGIDEYRLADNGLGILLVPDHSAPVVTFEVTYRVGSRNEVTGTTGATHILEHMMFKGSEGFNDAKGNSVKQYLERIGGQYNANTSVDRTTYFATVGRESLEGYIAIGADRMRRLLLRETDRQAEMTVVRNEYERGKNDPNNVLMEEVTAAAYVALPYHHPVIGWKS